MRDQEAGPAHVAVERLLHASIEEVFSAWTDPASMGQWLAPTGRAEVEADVRVGGGSAS
ncbi:MAG: SRPBCC family protein [Actinomycetota bacterium]